MSLIDEQKDGTRIRIPESSDGKEESNPIVIKEGESKLIMTQVCILTPNSHRLFMSKYNFNVNVDVTKIIDKSALNFCLAFAKYFQM